MKEIDFLPEWYKQRQLLRRQHRDYYIGLGLILFIMLTWSVFANGRVAQVKARNTKLKDTNVSQSNFGIEYSKAQAAYSQIKTKADDLKLIETKIRVSNLLAELSYIIDGRVVLSRMDIQAEPFEKGSANSTNSGALRVAGAYSAQGNTNEGQMVRSRLTLAGIAANAAEVAQLISKLEASDYFIQIIPGFSRNVTVNGYQGSEFEISCYLANYEIDN